MPTCGSADIRFHWIPPSPLSAFVRIRLDPPPLVRTSFMDDPYVKFPRSLFTKGSVSTPGNGRLGLHVPLHNFMIALVVLICVVIRFYIKHHRDPLQNGFLAFFNSLSYYQLSFLWVESLELRHLHANLLVTYKLVFCLFGMNLADFLQLVLVTHEEVIAINCTNQCANLASDTAVFATELLRIIRYIHSVFLLTCLCMCLHVE